MVKVKTKAAKRSKTEGLEESHINELKAQLARALADYDNLKKRVDIEKAVWFKVASGRVVGKLLPIMDMMTDAQKHLNDPGLAIVLSEFRRAIEDEGFEEVKVEAGVTEFDSKTMEAVEVVEGDDKNKVAEVVLTGWVGKEETAGEPFVIRPAKVKVYGEKTSD